MGFRNYLQYCKCYTFYFVIQLFSDPDKLEFKLSLLEQSMIAKFIQGMLQINVSGFHLDFPDDFLDHYTFLGNSPPTPPLSQHFALSAPITDYESS